MSGTVTNPLLDAEKVDCRRFTGYPAYGLGPGDDTFNRYFTAYEQLEYRIANLDTAELAVARQYLTNLNTLEAAIPASGANLDTDQAAVWTHNKQEVRDRSNLFDDWRTRLCGFLGVEPGPYFLTRRSRTVRLVI